MASNTYSFKDVTASIRGPNGSFEIGASVGASDEGISVEMLEDKASMTTGAGRGGMHSLHASNAGTITIRLLKTSPLNALLSDMSAADFASSAVYGQNVITIRDVARGDLVLASGCGFKRQPNNAWGKTGGMIEWSWNCIDIDQKIGSGSPAVI